MSKALQVNTVTQRADQSVWKKIDANNWKQIQDGRPSGAAKAPSTVGAQPAGQVTETEWDRLRAKYDLDGHVPDTSVPPEHVSIDVEGDIDTKPVLKWKDAAGNTRKSYTRAFHVQRGYQLHKACKEHSQAIFAALDAAEELVRQGDDGAATAYAALLTGHRPKVFMGAAPERVRVYRGAELTKGTVDDLIEKADTRDPKHPNRVHVMYDHPRQGAAVSSFYDQTLADHLARGGSFGDPSAVMDALGMSAIDFGVVRQHANLRMTADYLSKTPYPNYGTDFESWNQGAQTTIADMSTAVATHYGHSAPPPGMSFVPVAATVAAVDELGGGKFWPGTFPERKPYVESLVPDQPASGGGTTADEIDSELDAALADSQVKKGGPLLALVAEDVATELVAKSMERLRASSHIDMSPPDGVRAACRAGIELVEQGHGGDGLRPATVAWARKLAAGNAITPEKARKMNAWFARHSKGSSAQGLDDKTSPAWVAWQLWGGNAGKSWSAKLVRQLDAQKQAAQGKPSCVDSVYEDKKSSTELSSTPSQPLTLPEPTPSTLTTKAPSSKTPTLSLGPSHPQENLLKAKAWEVFAESVLVCLQGRLSPMVVVEAARCVLIDDYDGVVKAIEGGVRRGAPEGQVKPDKTGQLVQKKDGEWVRYNTDPEEPTIENLRAKLKKLKAQGGDPKLIAELEQKIAALSGDTQKSSFDTWKTDKLEKSWAYVKAYCHYMGYTRADQFMYAVAADDTPVPIAQAAKDLAKSWGMDEINTRLRAR